MIFLGCVLIVAVIGFGGVYIGDPTFRPDHGHWKTEVKRAGE
jgi:hypothetical protein